MNFLCHVLVRNDTYLGSFSLKLSTVLTLICVHRRSMLLFLAWLHEHKNYTHFDLCTYNYLIILINLVKFNKVNFPHPTCLKTNI